MRNTGAPRSAKMGNIASPWRDDIGAYCALGSSNLQLLAIRASLRRSKPRGPLCPPRVPEHRDRPHCDIAHQPDLGQIPSFGQRFCDEREFAPA